MMLRNSSIALQKVQYLASKTLFFQATNILWVSIMNLYTCPGAMEPGLPACQETEGHAESHGGQLSLQILQFLLRAVFRTHGEVSQCSQRC